VAPLVSEITISIIVIIHFVTSWDARKDGSAFPLAKIAREWPTRSNAGTQIAPLLSSLALREAASMKDAV
jgi:hypothetical protein